MRRLLRVRAEAGPLLADLFAETLSPTPTNLSLVWQTLTSLNYFPGVASGAVDFWTSCLVRAIHLSHSTEIPLDEVTIPALIHTANTSVYIGRFAQNLKPICVLLGSVEPKSGEVHELPLAPLGAA
jgi:hypothetical protein